MIMSVLFVITSKLMLTAEGIYIPSKTVMVDIRPPLREYELSVSLGIGKVLNKAEKQKLPEHVLQEIYGHYGRKEIADEQNSVDAFIAIAFAEAYNVSTVFRKQLAGTFFLALVKTRKNEFNELEKIEKLKANNIYINIIAPSAFFVLFYRNAKGEYKILKVSAGG